MPQKHAPEVPIAHAQLRCQYRHGRGRLATLDGHVQLFGCKLGQNGLRIGGGPETACGCQLGSAAQARPETLCLGLRGGFKKKAIRGAGQFHPADGATINSSGGDTRKKDTVPSRIPLSHGLVAARRVQPWSQGLLIK